MPNRVKKEFSSGYGNWTAPAGVTSVQIRVIDKFDKLVSPGATCSYALKKTGQAFASGLGTTGEFGDGTIVSKSSLSAAGGANLFVQVTGGANYATALKADGSAWGWGSNSGGQLGDNTIVTKSVPTPAVGSHSFIGVSSGWTAAFGLKVDGSVWAWGLGTGGQLGDGTIVTKSSPVPVVGGHSFIQVSAANAFGVALKANGSVWSWGFNTDGQLGDNTIVSKSSPVPVVGGHSFIQVSAGITHSAALKSNGSVWSWGSNTDGQLGDNNSDPSGGANRSSPVAVVGSHSFIQIAASNGFGVALKADGSVWGWGTNASGQLGKGNTSPQTYSSPTPAVGSHSFINIATGNQIVFALKADGTIWSWGNNLQGQLGDNTIVPKSTPVMTTGGNIFQSGSQLIYEKQITVVPGTVYNLNTFVQNINGIVLRASPGNSLSLIIEYDT